MFGDVSGLLHIAAGNMCQSLGRLISLPIEMHPGSRPCFGHWHNLVCPRMQLLNALGNAFVPENSFWYPTRFLPFIFYIKPGLSTEKFKLDLLSYLFCL